MGKQPEKASSPLKRNNVRVDPSTLSHYLCYYCGKMSSDRLEYQQHMLKVHEVMSQSYQLWSDQMMDTLGLRWSETKRQDEEVPGSYPPSPKSAVKDSDDDDEDYVCEEEERPAKRRKTEDSAKRGRKKVGEKQKQDEAKKKAEADAKRKIRAEQRRREEKARKEEERRKADEARKELDFQKELDLQKEQEKTQAAAVAVVMPPVVRQSSGMEMSEDDHRVEVKEGEKKRRRRESKKKEEPENDDKTEVSELVKRIFEESKKKELSSQEVEDETVELTDEERNRKPLEVTCRTTKYCKVCKKGTHFTFITLFQHYIDHHRAVLQSFNFYGFTDKTLVGKKRLLERKYCQRCLVEFQSSKDYFTHMVNNHMFESISRQLGFENANNADVEAILSFRDRLLKCGYNFKFDSNGEVIPDVTASPAPSEEKAETPSIPEEEDTVKPNDAMTSGTSTL